MTPDRTTSEPIGAGPGAEAEKPLRCCVLATGGWSHRLSNHLPSTGALIIGGVVFSLLDHRRTHRNHDLGIKSILEAAFDADLAAQRDIAERAITEPPVGSEPYFHHEDHAESPGYDEGQLLSTIPETTPFFEHFESETTKDVLVA